jgi:hypothetical protein
MNRSTRENVRAVVALAATAVAATAYALFLVWIGNR